MLQARLLSRINFITIVLLLLASCLCFQVKFVQSLALDIASDPDEPCGPQNLLKTMATPFTTLVSPESEHAVIGEGAISLRPIAISPKSTSLSKSTLEARFHGPKLFLPSTLVLGKSEEFSIKGNPGFYCAIAMSEDNKGAKSVDGHKLRLGADRKLVAVGKIPESGVLALFVETPIQGDLVGAPLYFEAAVWSNPDFSDMQVASTISTAQENTNDNGVIVAAQPEEKKQRAVVFDLSKPISTRNIGGLSSGKP